MRYFLGKVVQQWRRTWDRWHSEKVVVTSFWPGDYRIGEEHSVTGHCYRITR